MKGRSKQDEMGMPDEGEEKDEASEEKVNTGDRRHVAVYPEGRLCSSLSKLQGQYVGVSVENQ